ncbi:hypothetical protein HMPREF0765_4732 [Sphingobacterium spiritivorum ATCC 33300]|uniref:Uncharacterized protein n=1 Tax=Sphingobacterium spiritivorum ATCC 33300 TaxID=525372 RepID=C2G576_SPHSI|nr:hypothetical protein HMPREF0765_4732 [Sphingobacterium spiritivorum ATCC 33300]
MDKDAVLIHIPTKNSSFFSKDFFRYAESLGKGEYTGWAVF